MAFHGRKPVLERERERGAEKARTYAFSRLSQEVVGERERETVVWTGAGHSFSLIACTRPSGPHVRDNGQRRVGV